MHVAAYVEESGSADGRSATKNSLKAVHADSMALKGDFVTAVR
jgi:hypothetical protein